jgi:hypothetical protein
MGSAVEAACLRGQPWASADEPNPNLEADIHKRRLIAIRMMFHFKLVPLVSARREGKL